MTFDPSQIESLLHEAYIVAEGTRLRDEDRRKAVEVAALLTEMARHKKRGHLVDAAAGKAYVGVLAAKLIGYARVTVIEREADRVRASREAALRLGVEARVQVIQGDVGDTSCWPGQYDLAAGLHACGPASDSVIEAVSRSQEAKWLFLVPCCYGERVPFAKWAEALAERAGVGHHSEVRRRLVTGFIDAERTLRLEAAGWEVTVVPFVPPTLTPHHLLWRARRTREATRMAQARAKLGELASG
ncbi:MAG: methyltransferase [Deltaproteobacteria bacterium]|nr:methyltransferase [Deltaproteobacteria bacterium]